MARPVMRSADGRWSLTQVAHEAAVPHRTARTVSEHGHLDSKNLTINDVAVVKVAAAMLDAPRPAGVSRATLSPAEQARNAEAVRLTRQYLAAPVNGPEANLLVGPTWVVFTKNVLDLAQRIDGATEPVLVVPLGQWTEALREVARGERSEALRSREML